MFYSCSRRTFLLRFGVHRGESRGGGVVGQFLLVDWWFRWCCGGGTRYRNVGVWTGEMAMFYESWYSNCSY